MVILTMALLVFLLILGQQALYRRFWDRNLDLKLSFSTAEATEGDHITLTEELTNKKLLPLPWVTAKFRLSRHLILLEDGSYRVSDGYYQNDLFSISMYQRIIRRQEFLCARRGYYRIRGVDLGSSNIFISHKLVRRLTCRAGLTVLPRLIPHPALDIVYRRLYGDIEVRSFVNPDPFAFRGIREYGPRDSFRAINFRATAQTGQLMVNMYGTTASQELVILLNLEPYSDFPSDEVYEESIRIAASVADRFCGQGLSVGLVSNGRDAADRAPVALAPGSGAGHAHNILEKLARIDLEQERPSLAGTLAALVDPEPVYLLVSGACGAAVREAFGAALARGLTVRWVLPALPDTDLRMEAHPKITRWEVEPGAQTHIHPRRSV